MTGGPSVAIQVIGENALDRWRDLIGPMDAEVAKREAPHTLRAIYGTDVTRNGVHGSKDEEHIVLVICMIHCMERKHLFHVDTL